MEYAAAQEWKELIIQTHSPAFMTSGMSHRIYGPLQFHSCKTNNGSAWLNCTKYRISLKIPTPRGKQRMEIFCANIPRMEIIWKSPCCLSSYQATDICSPVCGKSWHISNRCWHIFRNPGISRITASYLKAVCHARKLEAIWGEITSKTRREDEILRWASADAGCAFK